MQSNLMGWLVDQVAPATEITAGPVTLSRFTTAEFWFKSNEVGVCVCLDGCWGGGCLGYLLQ